MRIILLSLKMEKQWNREHMMSWLQEKDDTAICGILTSEKWWERSEYRMLHSIKKLIGDKGRQLIVPIVLMSLDAIGSLVMYLMLYFTVVHLLSGTLSGTLVRNYTIVCLISVILRLIIYRSGYFLCFSSCLLYTSDAADE